MSVKFDYSLFIERVIHGTSIFTLVEMAMVGGPPLWRLFALCRADFASHFHLGRYPGMEKDKLGVRLKQSAHLRSYYLGFRDKWAKFEIVTPCSFQRYYLNWSGYQVSFDDVPSFYYRSEERSPYEYTLEWSNGNGPDRRKLDSNGKVVDSMHGYPCRVISHRLVLGGWVEWDDAIMQAVTVYEYGAKLSVRYQYSCGALSEPIHLYPDSEIELRSFIESGFWLYHPLVKIQVPGLAERLAQEAD